jgi:hypothetical protein
MTFDRRILFASLLTAVVAALSAAAAAAQTAPTPDDRVAALKQSLAENQARLRGYEWVETTIISLKGDEKARTQKRCYYGADGKVQKVAIEDAAKAEAASGGGGRGGRGGGGRVKTKIVENKKDDMQEYMQRAGALIQQYVPPQPDRIQKVKDSGKLSITPGEQGVIRLALPEYVQAGDLLTIDINAAAKAIAAVNVATYLDKPEDAVTLDVKFATLPDGTSYTSQTTLDAKAKNIRVVVQDSGYRKATP